MKRILFFAIFLIVQLCSGAYQNLHAQTANNPAIESQRIKAQIDSLKEIESFFLLQHQRIEVGLQDTKNQLDSLERRLAITQSYLVQTEGSDYYTQSTVRVLDKPSFTGNVIGEIEKGAKVFAFEVKEPYLRVRSGELIGWINRRWLAKEFPQNEAINFSRNTKTAIGATSSGKSSSSSRVKNCCKVCRKGQACGDSCIARNETCHKGPGCACQGY